MARYFNVYKADGNLINQRETILGIYGETTGIVVGTVYERDNRSEGSLD